MSTRAKPKPKAETAAIETACPVEALMREHASLMRAHDLAKQIDDSIDDEDEREANPIMSDYCPQHLWHVMLQRINALTSMAVQERPTSEIGALYQLILARTEAPVAELCCHHKKGDVRGLNDAWDSELSAHAMIDSVIYFMLDRTNDPDIDRILKLYGPPSPMSSETAVRNLVDAVRKGKTDLKVVS